MPSARSTRSLACEMEVSTRVWSPLVFRIHPAFPHAMVLTAYFVISPVIGLFCHRHLANIALSAPGRADMPPQNLTPASRRQDHTTSPSEATSFVCTPCNRSRVGPRPAITIARRRCRVHCIPPRVRDDRDTPLEWGGTARVVKCFGSGGIGKYFL